MLTPQLHYGPTAKAFHWAIVALLVVQAPLGWLMRGLRRGMPPDAALTVHVSLGLTILLLIVLRFLWRLSHPVAPESYLPAWQRLSSEWVHWLLYLAVLLTALTGWLLDSARGVGPVLFGLSPMPRLVGEGSAFGQAVGRWHATLVWVLVALVAVHVAAAFIHLLVYRDRVMQRMLPGERSPAPPPVHN
ncbi:MAG TPA: cytochrome b/b6 domain-containing protein [Stellaceae bacterium]|jgi:cytochrome b561|nr:cytochrome b/b6 domain-containing protein [Stellaceae bacterium]